jgi:hypothetical protein
MRCNDFDVHIDEMLSGVLHPEANQHMRQCERCTSHFRARAAVQNGLRKLSTASAMGPSRATDRAVMDAYRRLQLRRGAQGSDPVVATQSESARLFTFPSLNLAPAWTSRTWWTGAAAAAMVFAVFGSAVHLWHDTPTVNAPVAVVAPASQSKSSQPSISTARAATSAALQHIAPRKASPLPAAPSPETASDARSSEPVMAAKAPARPPVVFAGGPSADSSPVTELSPNVPPVIRLASTGSANNNVAQSASSTWPGYSNLMYCDPVVCSGPMQVVHIKVPVGEVKPNLGQTDRNAFVNAEVVVGPDGVARAIRVAN